MVPPGFDSRGHMSMDAGGRLRSDDSWIEISSQPSSSSSLSSAADEIVTTGLRVQHGAAAHRQRRQRPAARSHLNLNVSNRALSVEAGSSQEEYEESESDEEEEDGGMTSSGEGLTLLRGRRRELPDSDGETAVNQPLNDDNTNNNHNSNSNSRSHNNGNYSDSNNNAAAAAFTPQPNAFSHPSSGRRSSQPVPGSYFPAQRRPSARHSYPSRVQHSPFNAISPSYNAAVDHEAALRASLSTLQSFAAAARGLPKSTRRTSPHPLNSTRVQPNTLRMIPASALTDAAPQEPTFQPTLRRSSTSTSASADLPSPSKSDKRKAGRQSSKERRAVKKRRSSVQDISPTLFTWVVSVGVVVVFSAISFSAGYSMGKEAGRFEAISTGETCSCAGEASRGVGLRRLRLGAVAA